MAYRIMIEFILSLSKGLDSEFVIGERFVETKATEFFDRFEGRIVLSNRPSFGLHFEVVVLKGFKRILFFSYFFS